METEPETTANIKWHGKWTYFSVPPNMQQRSKEIIQEFFQVTPIHCVRYFANNNSKYIEKIWWLTVFLTSTYLCTSYIVEVIGKWKLNPIIVTFDQQPASIYTIPFPAVTVCPETKVKSSQFKFTEAFELVRSGQLNESTDAEKVKNVLALLQLCDHNLYDRNEEPYDNEILKRLRKMSIPSFEVFNTCHWKGYQTECLKMFRNSLTERGFCYTFNSLANNDIMKTRELHSTSSFNSETRHSDWSLDSGYRVGVGSNAFPLRVSIGGYHGSLGMSLVVNKSDIDYLCGDSFQGYKVMLHMPNELPQMSHQFFRVPLDTELTVAITPQVMLTGKRAETYSPQKRHCYYSNERKLRYFQIYTEKNCEAECLANYTLDMCECVRFSMPRSQNTPICTLHDSPCYQKAVYQMLKYETIDGEQEKEHLGTCNCMPACNDIVYQTQISQAPWNWQNGTVFSYMEKQFEKDEVHQSKVIIYFKETQFIPLRRTEIIGVSEMIASCGGLMGLFLGVSIVSLVELVYYITLKPVLIWMGHSSLITDNVI
ncbi:pickpocket protein 28-like [Uranotaenia lowii]|uniref:pickpocket protein 28-like n=1 Tax=Uranotaenia lowii TaxID=190385 RepID=UPI0024789586|nr:pickpocket protein 28-like [Uranotaenia lowii]